MTFTLVVRLLSGMLCERFVPEIKPIELGPASDTASSATIPQSTIAQCPERHRVCTVTDSEQAKLRLPSRCWGRPNALRQQRA